MTHEDAIKIMTRMSQDNFYGGDVQEALKLGIKALTERLNLPPKQEWSEEDEKMLKWLCRIVHSQRVTKVITLKEESELGEWMDKWLNHNPQPHWKPSEEQMKHLKGISVGWHPDLKDCQVLSSLYNDLQKL